MTTKPDTAAGEMTRDRINELRCTSAHDIRHHATDAEIVALCDLALKTYEPAASLPEHDEKICEHGASPNSPCYICHPREESARTEDGAAIQARATFEVDPYEESESLVYACNLLDVAKQDWGDEWTEHDERIRAGLSAMIARRAPQPTPPSTAAGCEDLLVKDCVMDGVGMSEARQDSINAKVREAYSRNRERWVSVLKDSRAAMVGVLEFGDRSEMVVAMESACKQIDALLEAQDSSL